MADLGFKETTRANGNDANAGTGLEATGSGSYQLILDVLNGIYDVQSLIDEKNKDIADIQTQIQASTVLGAVVEIIEQEVTYFDWVSGQYVTITIDQIYVSGAGDITLDDAITLIDAEIEFLDAKIATQQKVADKYKAQLDALLASDDENIDTPVEPETPAEDETPSEEQPAA